MQPGDKIIAVDNQHPRSVDALLAYLQDRAGQPVQVMLQRNAADGKPGTLTVPVTPTLGETKLGKSWMLGIKTVPPPVTVEPMDPAKAFAASYTDNIKNSQLIFDVLHRLFTRQVSVKSLSSPVGMSVQVNEAFEQQGWFPIIATMAMISLNLGIFNLLPIPILDGGMIVFLLHRVAHPPRPQPADQGTRLPGRLRLPGALRRRGHLQRHYQAAPRASQDLVC